MSSDGSPCGAALDALLREAVEGLFVLDGECRFLFFSEGCEALSGETAGAVIGAICPHAQPPRPPVQVSSEKTPGQPSPGGEPSFSGPQPVRVLDQRGQALWLEADCIALRRTDAELAGVIGLARAVSSPVREQSGEGMPGVSFLDVLGRAVSIALAKATDARALASLVSPPVMLERPLDRTLVETERNEIVSALRRSAGRRAQAARDLNISRSRLYRRMQALGIDLREEY